MFFSFIFLYLPPFPHASFPTDEENSALATLQLKVQTSICHMTYHKRMICVSKMLAKPASNSYHGNATISGFKTLTVRSQIVN